jgi:peptide/nickel transport system ATP-binding protein
VAEDALLAVEDLVVDLFTAGGPVRVLDGISFAIGAGEVFGLCGESGSGKSTLALALPRLLPPPAVITAGRAQLGATDLFALAPEPLRKVRGRRIGLVPQSAMNALNPLMTIAAQIVDALAAHAEGSTRGKAQLEAEAARFVSLVGLPPEAGRAYPHELSGGMRQRAALAIALAPGPELLIMDEATGGFDVVLQRQLCERLLGLAKELGFAILFISHDLPLVLALASRVGVLCAGRLVEVAAADDLRRAPQHPYSKRLLGAFLDPGKPVEPLAFVGTAGHASCPLHPRCPVAIERCARERPALASTASLLGPHLVACHVGGGG